MSDYEYSSLDLELIEELGSFAYDPRGFVQWAFPWGEQGELERFSEPYAWQIDYLEELGDRIRSGRPTLMATTSGHGTGKSALNGMETWWAFSTFPGTRGVITANTDNQLRTKTWVEMAKWHRLFIARHLFKYTATALFSVDEEKAKEWRMDIVPWSERNTEAFAGLHNAGGRIVILFDEASAIPDIIWETTEGALTDTDTEILWSVKGNPTRNQGRFRECFPGGRFAARWSCREIDSRSVPGTNKEQIEAWREDYGEDSDFFRIRVLGKFPRQDQSSFIPLEIARAAAERMPERDNPFSVVLGVDVGRFGDDPSVIYPRQGRDARTRMPEVYLGLSMIQLADKVASAMNRWNADAVFVDGGGVGGGLVDILNDRGLSVYEVQFGGRADHTNNEDPLTKYANKRAEIWGALRHALQHGLCIVDKVKGLEQDSGLVSELTSPTYDYNVRDEIVLESKKDMKRRGVASPNLADALALTYAYPSLASTPYVVETPVETEYNPYELERIF
jgi:hypothetical protein